MKMWSSSSPFITSSSSATNESPLHSIAQYIEDYMDLVENVPNDIARQITQLHEHNHRYHQLLNQLESTLDLVCNKTTNDLRKRNCLLKIQRSLIEIQEIADEKLLLIQSILDQLDGKARQLDFDYRSVTLFSTTPNVANNSRLQLISGNTSAVVATNHSSSQRSEANNSSVNIASSVTALNNTGTNEVISKEVLNGNSNGASTTSTSNMTTTPSTSLSGKRASARRNTTSRGNHDSSNDTNSAKRSVKRGVKASNKDLKRSKNNSALNNNMNSNSNSSLLMANNSPPNIYEGAPIDPDEPTYCLCEQVSFGEMICCDNSTCKIEWFHFSCVSLNTKPKGKWFCPNCRGERSNIPKK